MKNLSLALLILISLVFGSGNSVFGQWDFNNETIDSYTSYEEFYGTWDNSQNISVGYMVWDIDGDDGRYTAVVTDNDIVNKTITIKYLTYSNNHYPIYTHSLDGGNTYTDCVGDKSAGNYGYTYTFTYENATELTYNYNEVKTIYFHEGSSVEWFIEIRFNTDTTANDILTYSFDEQTGPANIDATNHIVEIEVAEGTDLTSLISTFTLSYGATAYVSSIEQESDVTDNNFTNDVIYSVMAENGDIQDWTIKVSEYEDPNNVENINDDKIISLYPNPTKGTIRIESDKTIERIEVLDINGRVVKQIQINYVEGYAVATATPRNDVQTIDLSNEAKGIYFVKLISESGVSTQKVVLE